MLVLQWKSAGAADLMDSKLKCVFESSADGIKVRFYTFLASKIK